MKQASILEWATDCLSARGYPLARPPEVIIDSPWSKVLKFVTSREDIYLKQTPSSFSLEPKVIQLLNDKLHHGFPAIIAINDELNCFLMKDAGQTLRTFLHKTFNPEYLYRAIQQFTSMQRSTESFLDSLLELGVPDWRLNNLPVLYTQLINQIELLKIQGMTEEEIQILHNLKHKFTERCVALSKFEIPETLVQPDFNTNNLLIDLNTNKLTLVDLGEIVIAHPFFSLQNFLYQATLHEGIKEADDIYQRMQETCCEAWLNLKTKKQLLDVFAQIKNLWPIYFALAYYRLMLAVDQQALISYDKTKPNRLASFLRQYIASN